MNSARSPMRSFLICCVVGVLVSVAGTALAEDGRWYVGVSGTAEFLDASYDKITDNTDPRNMAGPTVKGNIFHDSDSSEETGYGFGLLGGYRLPLNDRGLYLIGEIDVTFHGGEVEGQLLGSPRGQDVRNNYGQSWPENWFFEKDKSYGLTLKLGGSPALLTSWAGDDASLYALAGVRHVETEFKIAYAGCGRVSGCTPDEDLSGSDAYDRDFLAWVGGAGMEKMIDEHFALRGEARYTWYQSESWTSLPDEGRVRVPAELDNGDLGLSLSLVRYF